MTEWVGSGVASQRCLGGDNDFTVDQVWEVSDECMEPCNGHRTYRMNVMTSWAEGLFESLRNSINAWTMLAASENLMAMD